MPDLVVTNLAKQYPTRSEPLVVLHDVSLEMSAGENLAILGPSGCGKSTLLQILGTLDRPTSGHVTIGDVNPFALKEPQLADFRNEQVGFVFQDHHLLPQCTVVENVLVPAIAQGAASPQETDRAMTLLSRVGLLERLDHYPPELSGGERQRVAIARALVRQPKLLLADEPTGNLDRTTGETIGELLLELQKEQSMMLIVVTHSERLAAMLQRRAELDEGTLRQEAL